MTWRAAALNTWLRLTEKPFLTRASSAASLRRSFELKSRLFFHGPLGVQRTWSSLAGAPCLTLTPRHASGARTVFYLHGGAHVFGSPRAHAPMVAALTKRAGAIAVIPRYPLAPEHPFPAALEHCMAAYNALLANGTDPASIVLGGDSAGGNLVFAMLAELIRTNAPLPAGAFALSPLMDLTFSGASFSSNASADVVLPATRITDSAQAYLNGHPADDPRASPLFADFTGGPPVWITVGDTEILYDDSTRTAERLRAQGVAVELIVEQNLPHVWPLFHNLIPEARSTLDMLAAWIKDQTAASDPIR